MLGEVRVQDDSDRASVSDKCRMRNAILTVGLLISAATVTAQQPAPSNVRGGEYPKIDSDRRVTFHVKAPIATNVAVAARADDSGMNGNKPYMMTRGEN